MLQKKLKWKNMAKKKIEKSSVGKRNIVEKEGPWRAKKKFEIQGRGLNFLSYAFVYIYIVRTLKSSRNLS